MTIELKEGDIITVKCRVTTGTKRWNDAGGDGDEIGRAVPIDRPTFAHHSAFTVTAECVERLVRHHFEAGQTVMKMTEEDGRGTGQTGWVEYITKSGDWLVVVVDGILAPDVWPAAECQPIADPDFAEVEEAPVAIEAVS